MSFLGFMTRKETQRQIDDAVKAAMMGNIPHWLAMTAESEKYTQPDPSVFSNQADLFRKLSWILQAVDNTAKASAVTKFSVARAVGDKEPKDIPNHPFELLLKHPNPQDSRYEFLYGTSAFWDLNGNSFWWLNRESQDAPPDEMWIIPPGTIKVVPDEQLYIRGYLYYPGNGMEIFLEPWEITHFKRFNPNSRFIGLTAVEAIALTAQGLLGMNEWNTRLFKENNARLPGIITFEQMIGDDIWNKIKSDTREASKKRELMMLRGVGQGGVNWLQNAVSQKEMEFLAGIRAGAKEIMDTLAPGLYTWLSGESTYSNAGANRAAFNELTLYPKHVMMGEKITNEILPTYAKNSPSPERSLVGAFEDVRFIDKELKLREEEQFSKTHTVAEIREEFYGDDPLGDERDDLLPSQINAQSGGVQEPPPSPTPPAGQLQEQPVENLPPEEKPPEDKPAEPANKAALEDLSKWQRKALKKVGVAVEFTSIDIPDDVWHKVYDALPSCRSETTVKAVFDNARAELKPKGNEAAIVVKALLATLDALPER